MSRGFGNTYGVGIADAVSTGYTQSGSDRRSYAFWYYRNGAGGGGNGHIFTKGTALSYSERLFYQSNFGSGGGFHYDRSNPAGKKISGHNIWNIGTNNPRYLAGSTGIWLNAVLTHDKSSGARTAPKLFINGYSVNQTQKFASGSRTSDNSDPYKLGNGTGNWDGLLAHFAIWDDVILDDGEAAALAAGAHPMSIAPGNCVLYLPLDGIHNPEIAFTSGALLAPTTLTGTTFGSSQPAIAPLYIPMRGFRELHEADVSIMSVLNATLDDATLETASTLDIGAALAIALDT